MRSCWKTALDVAGEQGDVTVNLPAKLCVWAIGGYSIFSCASQQSTPHYSSPSLIPAVASFTDSF